MGPNCNVQITLPWPRPCWSLSRMQDVQQLEDRRCPSWRANLEKTARRSCGDHLKSSDYQKGFGISATSAAESDQRRGQPSSLRCRPKSVSRHLQKPR